MEETNRSWAAKVGLIFDLPPDAANKTETRTASFSGCPEGLYQFISFPSYERFINLFLRGERVVFVGLRLC